MLVELKLQQLRQLVESSTKEELIWMNGYLSGVVSPSCTTPKRREERREEQTITIAYGTETGNAKKLSTSFAATARERGITVRLTSLEQYRVSGLHKEGFFFVLISTHGEGEPPEAARKFYDYIHHQEKGALSTMKYGVLALGDTAYPLFCKAGEDIDAQLHRLGATRLLPLGRCDVDYETTAAAWFSQVLHTLEGSTSPLVPVPLSTPSATKRNVYKGTVLRAFNLNGRGSNKATQHIELAADDVSYLPGDAIGIIPPNPQESVHAVLALVDTPASTRIVYRGAESTLSELLQTTLAIAWVSKRVIEQYAAFTQQTIPNRRMSLAELLTAYPIGTPHRFEEFVQYIEPITPRLYSISSSPMAHPAEIHITVARHAFTREGTLHNGHCSHYLLQKDEGESMDFSLHSNNSFRLPAPSSDIIMIGAGTGIAPFRSFLAEREAIGASGRNWLFFGEQHFASDFLYQVEIQAWAESGVLNKANTAFSRDQTDKVYVQHKMLQHGAELFAWIESGASVYVCGAKQPMSADVEIALLGIVQQFGSCSPREAEEYLLHLKEKGRYLKDVY